MRVKDYFTLAVRQQGINYCPVLIEGENQIMNNLDNGKYTDNL